ncbi:MAG: RluA family pseudouridine synthase [Nitrospinaceae bacterium]
MTELHYLPPSEQIYESWVPAGYHGFPVEKYFASRFGYQSEAEWVRRIQSGRITVNGQRVPPGFTLRHRDRIVTRMGIRMEPPANRRLNMVYEDRELRVFNKAAPLPVHPSGRYFKNSMTELLKEVYPGEIPRPVQRLDAMTTGLIVFARSREAAACLMTQFQQNRIDKEYLAIVDGIPGKKRFIIDAPIGKANGSKRGIGKSLPRAKPARTRVEWLCTLKEQSLLKVIPLSGRTNQIRVHLASVGLPVANDPVYGRANGCDSRFGLHARTIRFQCFDRKLELTAACPEHFQPFLKIVADPDS